MSSTLFRAIASLLVTAAGITAASASPAKLDKSIVVLPEKAGIFVHERSRIGTPEVRDGVDADYEAPGKPGDVWIRVIVVPDGRTDDTASVAAQEQALTEQMRNTSAFVGLQALPATPITVDAPERGSLYANSRLGATRGWPVSIGSRQSFTYMDRDGQQTRQAGLVFHRHMAGIRLMVRVAAEDMGQAEFDALADEAARQIVPRLDIRNFGECPVMKLQANCARDEASATGAAPISGVQHALVYPLVYQPEGCRRDGAAPAGCSASATPRPPTIDALARDYLRLSLAMGAHDPAYVDAYYGPKELQDEATKAALSVDEIKKQALALQAALAAQPVPGDAMYALRLRFLQKQTVAMLGRIDVVQGKKLPFDEETARIYDVVAPHHDRAHFEAILRKIDALLPGPGTTAERVGAFREQFIIPRDKLEPVFKAAIAGCREQTLKHLQLPANESFDLEFVTNKPWGGYNWYKGNYHSLIQVNVELPIYIDRAIDIGCHEGYPGHHVYNMLLEQHLVNERKWLEYSVYPLFSPQSLVAEGSANYGVELAFPPAERRRFEREVLYPAAGIDPALVDRYEALTKLQGELSYANNEAARGYLDGTMTREQAIAWLVEVGLSRQDKAEQAIQFYTNLRSYVVNYNVGKDLVKGYVERQSKDAATDEERTQKRWQAFETLLSSPRLPGDLKP
jgi:hypothetical protein